jgi:hypothetical protein
MNDPESLIQPHEYLKIYNTFIKYISYPNLSLYLGENAIGYFCARINSTDIRRYQSQDARVTLQLNLNPRLPRD